MHLCGQQIAIVTAMLLATQIYARPLGLSSLFSLGKAAEKTAGETAETAGKTNHLAKVAEKSGQVSSVIWGAQAVEGLVPSSQSDSESKPNPVAAPTY